MTSEKPVFIQICSAPYNGNIGITKKEDYVAFPSNIMAENGYRSIIATVDEFKLGPLALPNETYTDKEVEINNFQSIFKLYKFLRKYKKATIWGNARTITGLTSCFFGQYRIFMNHHSTLPKKMWQRMILKFFLKRFHAIKGESEAEKRALIEFGVDPSKIFIIPIPIDYELFSREPTEDEKKKVGQKYGLVPEEKLLLFLCVLREHKRPDTVLKALKILKDRGIKVKLLQVGKDLIKERIGKSFSEMAKELNVDDMIVATGRLSIEELVTIMHISQVGIQSADVEGQCLVAFEYAAAGLPECLSNIPSFEVFKENILRHNSGDSLTLANNIEYYLSNQNIAKEHGIKNQKLVREQYNYDKIYARMKDLLINKKEELINKKMPSGS